MCLESKYYLFKIYFPKFSKQTNTGKVRGRTCTHTESSLISASIYGICHCALYRHQGVVNFRKHRENQHIFSQKNKKKKNGLDGQSCCGPKRVVPAQPAWHPRTYRAGLCTVSDRARPALAVRGPGPFCHRITC